MTALHFRTKLAMAPVAAVAVLGAVAVPGIAHADDAGCVIQGQGTPCTFVPPATTFPDTGIDLQAYCDTLGESAQVILAAPGTPNDWGCLYINWTRPDLVGISPSSGVTPPLIPNTQSAYVDFQAACREQYGDGTFAVLADPNNVRSWYCVSQDAQGAA
jgi:hypothetical protein